MNATNLALNAYAPNRSPLRTGRSTELQLFADITARIRKAIQQGPAGFPALAVALHENRRLWTTLAIDVADKDNSLPQALRAQIFYLAEFTHQQSSKVLTGAASADILVEINTAMMRGLGEGRVAA